MEKAKEAIKRVKPKIVIFGASIILFPQPVRALAETAKENGAVVGYDGSHVMGLIAGEQFQDSLREGACALFGSTHKTFFGPQGGIILADKEHGERLKECVYPAFVDNAHWNRIAALTLALAEMKKFGRDYAGQVIRNAQALASALYDYGLPVACRHLGFTRSHQVLLDYGGYEKGRARAEKLQRANIIVDCVIRVSTCEVTRRGMKEAEMLHIAELIKRVLVDEENLKTSKRTWQKSAGNFKTLDTASKNNHFIKGYALMAHASGINGKHGSADTRTNFKEAEIPHSRQTLGRKKMQMVLRDPSPR